MEKLISLLLTHKQRPPVTSNIIKVWSIGVTVDNVEMKFVQLTSGHR